MILYHGSNTDIACSDLTKCRPFKDFGRGFYLTSIEQQAHRMAKRAARIAGGKPCVNVYEVTDDFAQTPSLNVLDFGHEPSEQWAQFVIANRNPRNNMTGIAGEYDIVIGSVVNDDIALLFAQYKNGFIDLDMLKKGLTYRHLTNQVAFRTNKALALLTKTGVIYE